LDHRQAEGQGLARAGLRSAGYVRAGQAVGDCQGLDAERRDDAIFGQDVYEVLIDSEVEECWFS